MVAHHMFEEAGELWAIAWSDRYQGDHLAEAGRIDDGIDAYLRSVAGFADLGDRWSVAHSLDNLAKLIAYRGDPSDLERTRSLFRRALREAQAIDDPVWTAHGLLGVAWGNHMAGDAAAIPMLADARERLRLIGDDNCLGNASAWLAEALDAAGATEDAAVALDEALGLARALGHPTKIAINLDRAARIGWNHDERQTAARLVGAVDRAMHAVLLLLGPRYTEDHNVLVDLMAPLPDDGLDIDLAVPLAADLVRRLAVAEPVTAGT